MSFRKGYRQPPWFAHPEQRIRFLHEIQQNDPQAEVIWPRRKYKGGFAIKAALTPAGVPTREIEVHFSLGTPNVPHIFSDGPTDSPHRYSDSSLCIWYPYDPKEARWRPIDGPAALLGHIAAHLIKEQWYRRTGEWPGEQIHHA